MIEIFSSVTAALPAPGHAEITAALRAAPTRAEHSRLARAVTALTAIEYRPPETLMAPRRPLRLAAWNAERLKYGEASAQLFAALDCDVILLSEADIGMARSGNRNTIAELAASARLADQCDKATDVRLLQRLTEHGVVRRPGLHERAAYFTLLSPGNHSDYLICTSCGSIEPIQAPCPVHQLEDEPAGNVAEH